MRPFGYQHNGFLETHGFGNMMYTTVFMIIYIYIR